MNAGPFCAGRRLALALLLGAAGTARIKAQNDLALLAELCQHTQPDWTDAQRDSAQVAWAQWTRLRPPHYAEALAFLTPDQQFALERYQAQFGWPRDSTEWRALPLSGPQRELLQRLYHGALSSRRSTARRAVEPALAAGWSCSGCRFQGLSPSQLASGRRLALVGPSSRWNVLPWGLKSPDDAALRGFWHPEVGGLALHPGRLPSGAPAWARSVERVALSRGPASGLLGEVSLRGPFVAAALSGSAHGWWLVQGTWYGPGGLWVSVQRERHRPPVGAMYWERPAASATPWRAQRGNRATAALPLWAGRLTMAHTSSGPSASWASTHRSATWTPGQLAWGQSMEVNPRGGFARSDLTRGGTARGDLTRGDSVQGARPTAAAGVWRLRGTLYLGRAQGASLQLRRQRDRLQWEVGVAALTAREDVLPRALGPMGLWRPGATGECAVAWIDGVQRASLRLRCAPSGWSASLSAQWDLSSVPFQRPPETASKSPETTWPPPRRP